MRAAKHSPAPWTVEVHQETTSVESKYQTVASDVSNCDAALIAAAPEMLDFLRGIDCADCTGDAYAQVQRLIAKAEGRAK